MKDKIYLYCVQSISEKGGVVPSCCWSFFDLSGKRGKPTQNYSGLYSFQKNSCKDNNNRSLCVQTNKNLAEIVMGKSKRFELSRGN